MKRYVYLPDKVVELLKSTKLSFPRGLNTRENVPMSVECVYRLFRCLGSAHFALFDFLYSVAPDMLKENDFLK